MPKKENTTDNVIDAEAVESSNTDKTNDEVKKEPKISNDVLTRIFVTLLFALIGWISLWVFGIVILVQFGFLLITGHLNKNLKAFCGELGDYLSDIIKYVGFQSDTKPFPFQGWKYDEDESQENGASAK